MSPMSQIESQLYTTRFLSLRKSEGFTPAPDLTDKAQNPQVQMHLTH